MENKRVSPPISLPSRRRHLTYPIRRETLRDPQTEGDFGGRRWVWFCRNMATTWLEGGRELGQTDSKQLGFNPRLKGTPEHTQGSPG